ncbi:MAG: hypothetical protein KKA19_07580 [Candidatus Margulisbacteria bacterium]|nr:hypothetical protein [Candidatus Margulisiibacteriota bacterium]
MNEELISLGNIPPPVDPSTPTAPPTPGQGIQTITTIVPISTQGNPIFYAYITPTLGEVTGKIEILEFPNPPPINNINIISKLISYNLTVSTSAGINDISAQAVSLSYSITNNALVFPVFYNMANNTWLPRPDLILEQDKNQSMVFLKTLPGYETFALGVYTVSGIPQIGQVVIDGKVGIRADQYVNKKPEVVVPISDELGLYNISWSIHNTTTRVTVDQQTIPLYGVASASFIINPVRDYTYPDQVFSYLQKDLEPGKYQLKLHLENLSGTSVNYTSAIFEVGAQFDFNTLILGPNPYDPNNGFLYIYCNISTPSKVKAAIFSIAGEKLWEANEQFTSAGKLTWNGKDDFGQTVANGIYICYVQVTDLNSNKRETKKFKLAVLK